MIGMLAKSIREYKKASIATPLLVSMEAVMGCIIPFLLRRQRVFPVSGIRQYFS